MIKANELRIGNWVLFNGKEKILLQFDRHLQFITFGTNESHESPGIPHGQIQPIPLTEEWLLKFGGKEISGEDIYTGISFKINGILILVTKDKILLQSSHSKTGTVVLPRENYNQVHLFQNIFFALTGKELTLNSQPINK